MNIMGIVLPVAAVLIAGLFIAALWLWWGGGTSQQEDATDSSITISPSAIAAPDDNAHEDMTTSSGFHVVASSHPGKVVIQVGRKTYAHISEIADAALRDQISLQIQALQQFAAETKEYKPTPIIPVPSAAPAAPSTPVILLANTMADQIEVILQEQLLTLPHMHGRSIHILNSADGGVQIKVDDAYYDSVNDVQDRQIKTILQAAIQEWELRTHLS
jgi:nitrogen fixation-related uncharacterized protein